MRISHGAVHIDGHEWHVTLVLPDEGGPAFQGIEFQNEGRVRRLALEAPPSPEVFATLNSEQLGELLARTRGD